MSDSRKAAEQAYIKCAFDIGINPIGCRDWDLFFDGWQAAEKKFTQWTDDDKPLPEDGEIAAAHPLRSHDHVLYGEATRLVGAKRSKYALVDLVNWLLHMWQRKAGDSVQQIFVAEQKLSAAEQQRDSWKAKAEANERDARRYLAEIEMCAKRIFNRMYDSLPLGRRGEEFAQQEYDNLSRVLRAARSAEKEKE